MNVKYVFDFSGTCEIKAESQKQAIEKFWELVNNDKPLPMNEYEIFNVKRPYVRSRHRWILKRV